MIDLNVYYYDLENNCLWHANSSSILIKNVGDHYDDLFLDIDNKFLRDARIYGIFQDVFNV